MKSKILNWNDNVSTGKVIGLLKKGEVLVGPSDTVIGFYALATEKGFLSLNFIKKRTEKPYLLLISGLVELFDYVEPQNLLQAEKIMKACWPGPLTIIFKARKELPAYLTSHTGTIALRIPKHDKIQAILRETGPLFSTSANLSGDPIPASINDLNPAIVEKVAGIIEGGVAQQITPSTIIDLSSGELTLVREGVYSKEYLKNLLV